MAQEYVRFESRRCYLRILSLGLNKMIKGDGGALISREKRALDGNELFCAYEKKKKKRKRQVDASEQRARNSPMDLNSQSLPHASVSSAGLLEPNMLTNGTGLRRRL